jgi:DNA-binding transcriptional ArsR family regulator
MEVLTEKELSFEVVNLKNGLLIFRAINHRLRLQIVRLLHENGRMTVTDIFVKLKLEQSVASQHLAILRKAGFVHALRNGKFIYYSVNYERINQVTETGKRLIHMERPPEQE